MIESVPYCDPFIEPLRISSIRWKARGVEQHLLFQSVPSRSLGLPKSWLQPPVRSIGPATASRACSGIVPAPSGHKEVDLGVPSERCSDCRKSLTSSADTSFGYRVQGYPMPNRQSAKDSIKANESPTFKNEIVWEFT